MPHTTTPRRRNGAKSALADEKVAAALDRLRAAGAPITKAGLAREAGVQLETVQRRWAAITGVAPATKAPPPQPLQAMERVRLAHLLADATSPSASDADALAAARAAGRLLSRLGLTAADLLMVEQYPEQEAVRAAARAVRRRACAVMASPSFALLTAWQKGFTFSLSEWTATVSPRQCEALAEIEAKIAAADAAGLAIAGLTQGGADQSP
ncbi:hypothetical protein J5Y09_06750 [Roseomonas sp. PWR1]|uniref:Uncharacterized protein n=1 Tax=Roseomonas nitratireducens TaxID=2820810 RepID=A0ABS4ASN5_9PROT|nr:hypothetical protein [Neoroseomonas nitratireducens]MBP0463602.1 hypothetical protein [Neoroseomonas nitratireducens]